LWALSVFVGPMTNELTQWDRSDIFGAVTVRVLISAAGVPLVGRFMDKRSGAMVLSMIASGVGGAVLIGISRVQNPWEFMLLYGVIGGIAWVGQTNIIAAALVPKWFVKKRPIAMAIGTTGGGFAALVLPLIAAATISALGWRDAWVVYGVFTILIGVPLALLIRRQPEDIGLLPDGEINDSSLQGSSSPSGYNLKESLKIRSTWMLIAAVALASLPSIAIPANMVPLFEDRGFSQNSAALALSIYGLMSVSGRYFWGYIANQTTVRISFLGLVIMGALVMGLLAIIQTQEFLLFLLAAGSGLAIGGMIVLNPLIWPAYLGRAHLGSIQGLVYPLVSIVMAVGPVILSLSYDRLGSYNLGLWLIVITYLLSFAVMLVTPEPKHIERP
jgi:OFA family oxalate/formate antiporter-like MFS transporter